MTRNPPANQNLSGDGNSLSPMQQAILDIRSLRARLEASESRMRGPVAIVGMACRFPGDADTLQSFWQLLSSGTDAVGPIPADRWDSAALYDSNPYAPGKISTLNGGFLRNVDLFDAEFFGISDREAVSIDPQHRLLLEVSWEALENAGLASQDLFGTSAGVFIGISSFDYGLLRSQCGDRLDLDAYHATGMAHSAASGRLAYFLGLHGPSISIDTACSSSLVAVHLACQSLRTGECPVAIAGGVNLILSPEVHVTLSKARMMAPDGRCKAFDDRADGFVRSEGCGVLVLKLLSDAVADGDCIHAVIRGSACNQDGRSSGLTAPNGPAQTEVLRAAWRAAGIGPEQLDYVEAHGTGTALGDPIEAGALATALAGLPPEHVLRIGSLKTNLGHMEAAAGVGGLIKTVLALQKEQLPASLHFNTPSSGVDWKHSRLRVNSEQTAWTRGTKPRMAGVSSFGFTGTNVHVVLEEAPPLPAAKALESSSCLLTLSAHNETALRQVAGRLSDRLRSIGDNASMLASVAYTSNARSSHFPHRAAIVTQSAAHAAGVLARFASSIDESQVVWGRADPLKTPEVNFAAGTAPDSAVDLSTLARQYVQGARIDWKSVHRSQDRQLADLPGYPWNRRRYWFPLPAELTPQERWQTVLAAGDRQAGQAPLDLLPHTYADKYRALDELATAYILRALATLGAFKDGGATLRTDDLINSFGVLPLYRVLMECWLRKLAGVGLLSESAGAYTAQKPLPALPVESLETSAALLFADAPILLEYVKGCGRLLASIVNGKTSPLDTLFPGGSLDLAEELYHRAALSRYFNAIAAAVAGAFAQRHRGILRVLEVGAGTGGTTASILPLLPPDRTTYSFTDASEFFFNHAARRFANFNFLTFTLLDLERSPGSQGYRPGSYDLIVAGNVLHATTDLGQTLKFVRSLLSENGMLVLYEVTDPPAYFDISIALIEGWQKFDDGIRDTSPLLNTRRWENLLLEHGFEEVAAWPAAATPTEVLGSHVFVARVSGDAQNIAAAASPADRAGMPRAALPRDYTTMATAEDIVLSLEDAPESEHAEMLVDFVRRHVARVLRRPSHTEVSRDTRLMDLGLDSLMAVELRNNLSRGLPLVESLPATLIFDYPSIADIAGYLLKELRPRGASESNGHNVQDDEKRRPSADQPVPRMTAAMLEALPDEEVERLLNDKLEASEAT